MDRKKFIQLMGIGTGTMILASCLGGCTKDDDDDHETPTPASNVDFTLDLTQSANSALKNNGGYMVTNGVIVAKTNLGTYIAVQKSCTHEQYNLVYQGDNKRFYCFNHGATFSEAGAVTNGPATKSLVTYKTQLTGNSLRVYS